MKVKDFFCKMKDSVVDFFKRFVRGDLWTKLSYLVMGSSCFRHKQFVRGFVFLAIQVCYLVFMASTGMYWLSKLDTLGDAVQHEVWNEVDQIFQVVQGDNSLLILLFGSATIIISIAAFFVYVLNTKNAYKNQELNKNGKKINKFKDDVAELLDNKFYITILTGPVVTITVFIIIPLIFMILLAFTNYNRYTQPPGNLFTWVGFDNFINLFGGNQVQTNTFVSLFVWTIIWAVCATFLNYILGMVLALIINKKGIKFKGMWRTIFVITIAVPQFVSLMLMSKLLADTGALNNVILLLGGDKIPFLTNGTIAKVVVIIVNLWVGIPYTMLSTTGILMNIPADLYEAARIDGANSYQQFRKITLPYMMHVMTPYLITSFIGNINNFNVIFLLTGGGPNSLEFFKAGETDLLITWLYKLTQQEQEFALAGAVGIIIFVICATLSLITFNKSSALQQEDQFK